VIKIKGVIMAIDWIKVDEATIPDEIYSNGNKLLLKDEDGFIGVGYWDEYSWFLDIPGYRVEHDTSTFKRIKFYAFLD
jgi:hypothetical protein